MVPHPVFLISGLSLRVGDVDVFFLQSIVLCCSLTHSLSSERTHPVNTSSNHFHTDAVVPSSDHYGIETVAPSGDHCFTDMVAPSSDHHSTKKVAPPNGTFSYGIATDTLPELV